MFAAKLNDSQSALMIMGSNNINTDILKKSLRSAVENNKEKFINYLIDLTLARFDKRDFVYSSLISKIPPEYLKSYSEKTLKVNSHNLLKLARILFNCLEHNRLEQAKVLLNVLSNINLDLLGMNLLEFIDQDKNKNAEIIIQSNKYNNIPIVFLRQSVELSFRSDNYQILQSLIIHLNSKITDIPFLHTLSSVYFYTNSSNVPVKKKS